MDGLRTCLKLEVDLAPLKIELSKLVLGWSWDQDSALKTAKIIFSYELNITFLKFEFIIGSAT